jgi:uncharacterized protein (TIGR00369 family)
VEETAVIEPFGPAEMATAYKEIFAPWVQDLGLELVEADKETCTFRLPASSQLVREGGPGGGVVCGQALAGAADTVSVFALALINNRFRPNTTTDFSIRFLRPIPMGDVMIEVRALSNGRRLATTEVFFRAADSKKPGAHATCCFAWLDG